MKICFLATSNSIHSYKWINYFSKLGYEIIWISTEKKLYDISSNIRYIEIQSNYKFIAFLKSIFMTRKILKKYPVDFVHIHYIGFYGLISLFLREKCIATAWGSDILINQKNSIKKILIKKIIDKLQLITCDSYYLQAVLINTFKVQKSKIRLMNFGIDSKKFSKQPLDKKIKQNLGCPENLTIISSRGFEKIYDVETLIKAMPLVLKNTPKTTLILTGRGSMQLELTLLVKKLMLEKNVFFIGLVANEQLPVLLSNMDIYVSTSLSDSGLAASTAEAMTCEVPVVVSDVVENYQWIKNEHTGFLFPAKDYKKLAKILIKLLNDEKLRQKIGKAGRPIIVKNNDYENEMNKVNEMYKQLVK